MDSHSAVIELDIAFGLEATATALAYQAPVAVETFDDSAPDIDLCRMATGGNIAAFGYEDVHALAVFVDRPVDIAPPAGDFEIVIPHERLNRLHVNRLRQPH